MPQGFEVAADTRRNDNETEQLRERLRAALEANERLQEQLVERAQADGGLPLSSAACLTPPQQLATASGGPCGTAYALQRLGSDAPTSRKSEAVPLLPGGSEALLPNSRVMGVPHEVYRAGRAGGHSR